MMSSILRGGLSMLLVALLAATSIVTDAAETKAKKRMAPPKVGERAEGFKLKGVDGKPVDLEKLAKRGPVVVAVLRGYPGYQCPACTRQVAQYQDHAEEFAERKASVVLVYPGPAKDLGKRAEEFLKGTELPKPLVLALDPDYKFTNAYGLRWDALNETAFPSTFVMDADRDVVFARVSKEHGKRVDVKDVLKALDEIKAE